MKKLVTLALCAALFVSAATAALAVDTSPAPIAPAPEQDWGYAIYVDGKDTGKASCVIVPLRLFAEQLGFSVTWNGDGSILIDNGILHSRITIGTDMYQVVTSVEGQVGMSAPFSLGMAPFVMDGTTYVPLELFEVLLGNREGTVALENGVISFSTSEPPESAVQIPNPLTDCGSLAAAEELAGFRLSMPDGVGGSDRRIFRAAENHLLEVIYQKGKAETARIRKAPGSADISGDYTAYSDLTSISEGGVQITMKGDHGLVSLAIWTVGGYTYSVSVEDPISSDAMLRLAAQIQ